MLKAVDYNERRARLIKYLGTLPHHVRAHLEKTKETGLLNKTRTDWLWYSLIVSFSTMGNARGYAALMADPENLSNLSYESVAKLAPQERQQFLEECLCRSKIRMAPKKAKWLERNFLRLEQMGGLAEANRLAFDSPGKETKIAFLLQFDGIGDKYARNIWMDIYDPDFRSSIAIDQRIKTVSKALGRDFAKYEDHERFYQQLAAEVGLEGWELDRVLYAFLPDVLRMINGEQPTGWRFAVPSDTAPVRCIEAAEVMDRLKLAPLAIEGGFFRETYRSERAIPNDVLPAGYGGERSVSTAIYYLLTPETFSVIHRVRSDEVFHFYAGDPVEMLQLWPDGSGRVVVVGNDLAAGHEPQVVVPAGVWQGCRLIGDGAWALMGCTVAPGFDYADYEAGERAALTSKYPKFAEMVQALTRG